ncbi:MAG: hypothetical protein ACREGA_03165 [Candidatus Saccharimonadales bacterium]
MKFDQTPEFQKELKKLTKSWRSLPQDLAKLQKVLPYLYVKAGAEHFRKVFFGNKKAAVLQTLSASKQVVKIRLDCQSLGNKDLLRVTYIRSEGSILFVELYAKNQKPCEDASRIKRHL